MKTYTVENTGSWRIVHRVRSNNSEEAKDIAISRVHKLCETMIGKRFGFYPSYDGTIIDNDKSDHLFI